MKLSYEKTAQGLLVSAIENNQTVGKILLVGTKLESVWVSPALRGQGFGKKLVEIAVISGAKTAHVVHESLKNILAGFGWNSIDGAHWARG